MFSALSVLKILSIIPFNRMAADDFAYASVVFKEGFLNAQVFWYKYWSGRYLLNFLQTSYGSLLGHNGYTIWYSIVTFASLALSIFVIIKKYLNNKYVSLLVSLFLFSIFYYMTPNKMESWYWFSGSSTYMWPIILTLFAVGSESIMLSSILVLLASGGNETFTLISVFVYILLFFESKNKKFISLLLASIIGLAIVYVAPGNNIRAGSSASDSMNIFGTIFYSIQKGPSFLINIIYNNLLLLVTSSILLTYIFSRYKNLKRSSSSLNGRRLYITLFAPWLISIIYMVPAYKVLGRIPPDRSDITMILVVLTSIVCLSEALSTYLSQLNSKSLKLFLSIAGVASYTLFILAFKFTSTIAEDIYIAKGYTERYDSMIRLLNTASKDSMVTIDKLPESGLIPNAQVQPESTHWVNKGISDYYGIKGIIAK